MTARQFGRLFKETVKAAGPRQAISLHALRHHYRHRGLRARLRAKMAADSKRP
jgi:hypothetical protein